MASYSNPGLLAVALMEGSAAFILLVVYWLLAPGFPAKFLRYWMTGWVVYLGLGAMRIYSLLRGGPYDPPLAHAFSLSAAAIFFCAIIECVGRGRLLRWLLPLGGLAAAGILGVNSIAKLPDAAHWLSSISESVLFLAAGWALWRANWQLGGFGWKLLGGVLLLRGLHGFDQADWSIHPYGLFRVSFHGMFGIAMGIAMAVMVLEASRARTEDLNEKLRRLAIITAEATQSQRVQEALEGVLRHLVGSLGASHGLVFLLEGEGEARSLVLRASAGFNQRFAQSHARISPAESWAREAMAKENPLSVSSSVKDSSLREWMKEAGLASLAVVNVPGKTGSLGLLLIGSNHSRAVQTAEEHFLVNVANLIGLTVQNVALYESAAASRRQWLDTFDSIVDLIFVHDPEGRLVRANRALAWHLGVEPGAIEQQSLRDLLGQGDVKWKNCPYCEGAAGKPEEVDPAFGGHFLVTSSSFHDSEGNRLGTVHVLKDFTERRQAENKFRMLFENVQEGIFISTPDGTFLDFNRAFMEIIGVESREALLKPEVASKLYVNPADRERLKRLLREHGEVNDFEFQFRRPDGEIRTAHESSFVTRNDAGEIVAYQGFVLDVTERKKAELEIRRRNRELLALNSIAETLSQSVALEEVLGRALLKVNELFAADTSAIYLLDEAGKTVKRVAAAGHRSELARGLGRIDIPPVLLEQIRQARATLLSGSALAVPEPLREVQRAEGVRDAQVAILWSKERIIGALAIGTRSQREFSSAELNLLAAVGNQIATTIDKSLLLEQTREAYEGLRLAQEQLLQSEKMAAVGQLISGVAHELNNPLTAILGYSQLLKSEELTNSRGSDYLEKLYKQAQRTHHIVQNLLSFARQHKPERAPVDINQILEDTLVLREYDMKLNNIRIHREFLAPLPPAGGDFHQLQQVFLNILNNAVDAVGENGGQGEIWVRTELAHERIRVEFTDSGRGVQNPHRVFDPFYTTKPVGKGTGLGLSICYGIVKEHGGEIQVRNSPPRGATFTVLLPILKASQTAAPEQPSRARDSVTGTVLIVDDEEAVLHLEREVLRSRGIQVKLAYSAKEAIELLRTQPVDAVVTDMKMPGEVTPSAFYRWIEQHRSELADRVVFTISNAQESEISSALRKTPCAVVQKPFAIEDFWKAVRKALRTEAPATLKR
ncbi:MAG TPA: ATP-binding protein [Candidatus Sulfotelmatobacter sp.]|nr:ATP-binding protein [Candidatus Sulfotelmatobacter sp.]